MASVQSVYDQALRAYAAGMFYDALSLFLRVQDQAGPFRETQNHIALCAKALSEQRDTIVLSAVVERARGMLALRESALGDLRKQGGANVVVAEEVTSLQCPREYFKDDRTWDALNAFLATVPGAWVTLLTKEGSAEDSHAALLLAGRWGREGGFPLDRITLRSRLGVGAGVTLLVSPQKPATAATDAIVPGILIRADRTEFRSGENADLLFDLLMINSGNSRRWNLDIVDERAVVVRRFEGPPTATSHVRWDGRDGDGRWVPSGDYVAQLSVIGWSGDLWSDRTSVHVVREESLLSPSSIVQPIASVPRRRQHRFVIRFQENDAVPIERERDAASRVAYLLTINPEKNVVVMGQAEKKEKNPVALAAQRAAWVQGELERLGIPLSRIRVSPVSVDDGSIAVVAFED